MDCLPQDDLCNLQRDYAAYVREIGQDEQIDRTFVFLGYFNGRAYTYYQVNGKSVIMIVNATPDLKPKTGKIGKFEIPDLSPVDFLESDGAAVSTKGDDNHG